MAKATVSFECVEGIEFRRGWCLDESLRRHAAALLSQELWCWGRDIEHPAGNALISYGLARVRPPRGVSGSTRYEWEGGDLRVALWGFGVSVGHAEWGGMFLPRYEFTPMWRERFQPPDQIWQADRIRGYARPRIQSEWNRAHRLLQRALEWFADYERWFAEQFGTERRRESLRGWIKPLVAEADDMPQAWEELKCRILDCATST